MKTKITLLALALTLLSCSTDEATPTRNTKSINSECLTPDCSDATAIIFDEKNLTAPAVVVKRCYIIRKNSDGSFDAVGVDAQGRVWRYTARQHTFTDKDGVSHSYSGTGSICSTCKC